MPPGLIDQLCSAKVYDLEQPRFAGMPIHPSHRPGYFYALHRRHRDTYRPDSRGPRSSASGILTMMEHTGTHLDALCHQANHLRLFGGIEVDGAETPAGFSRLGVETVPPLLRRGVLLDGSPATVVRARWAEGGTNPGASLPAGSQKVEQAAALAHPRG